MPTGEMQWLRLWTDIIDDDKLCVLAFEDRWHYVAILCMKRRGILDRDDGKEMLDRRVGKKLGLGDADRDALRKRLMEARLVDSLWQPLAWGKRQFSSDSSTSRVKAFRERQRNGDETFHETQGNVSVTPPETETDSEKNPPTPQGGCVEGLDLQAWERWIQYRREIRKPFKPASIPAAQRKLAGFGSNQAAVVEQSIAQGWTGLFPLDKRAVSMRRPSIVT